MVETMTIVDAEEILAKVAQYEATIKASENERDMLIRHYQNKIGAAEKICADKCEQAQLEIAQLTEQLRRYAEIHLEDGKKSLNLPSGKLAFRKQTPRYFFDDLKEASSKDERLIKFVKHNAHEFLKVKVEESVDWLKLKTKLIISGGEVFYKDTGELIEGLHAQELPDKFTVTTT